MARGGFSIRAAASDVGAAGQEAGLGQREHALDVDAGRGHQRFGEALAFRERRGGVPGQAAERDDAADQGIAVGVRAGGAEADHQVARALAIELGQHAGAVDGADAEAGEVEVGAGVHAGHLRGLAADQGRAGELAALGDAGDDAGGLGEVQFGRGDVVEEQQRLGALGQEVVTHMATRSMPTPSTRPVSMAIFSLVPTPSVVVTSRGSS